MSPSLEQKAQDFLNVFEGCEIIGSADLVEKMKSRKNGSLRVKFGIDPTATELHLGWMVPLIRLRKLQDLGHTVVLVIGNVTAMIGDPSGRSSTRKQLELNEVMTNAENLLRQFETVLDMSKVETRFNSEWWSRKSLGGFLEMCSAVTVAQLMERNDFATRFKDHAPIGIHELLYPIFQAQDSVFIDCDVEIGGSDQNFNCMLGRDMMSHEAMLPQTVVLVPLLVGLDGTKKMSQSLGNIISVGDEPADMFGKVMSIPDELMLDWGVLLNCWTDNEAIKIELISLPKECKKFLALHIVTMCWGEKNALTALSAFEQKFEQRNPDETIEVPRGTPLFSVIKELEPDFSNSHIRRMFESGAVQMDGTKVHDIKHVLEALGDFILRCGKRRLVNIKVSH